MSADGTPYEGLDPMYAARLKALVDASGGRITLGSGYRSVQRQQELWDDAVRKYGSEAAARKWVAPPGRSNHNRGLAADLRYASDEAKAWAHQNAARFGLFFPMAHEDWHIEPIRTALEDDFDPEAYTTPPFGQPPVGDPHDPAFQMTRVLAMMDQDLQGAFATPGDPTTADNADLMATMGAAGGQIQADDGAAFQTFGFTEDPERIEESMEEQGLGNG